MTVNCPNTAKVVLISKRFSTFVYCTTFQIVKVKPTRIKETVTFVVQPDSINLRNPYDLEPDDMPEAFIKWDQVRFYQAESTAEGELVLSSEVRVTRNKKGQVVGRTYNRRKNGAWKAKTAKLRKLYAVVRKRVVHKNTLQSFATAFTWYVIFVMSLEEYNEVHGNFSRITNYPWTWWLPIITLTQGVQYSSLQQSMETPRVDVVIRHTDRRIRGKDMDGAIQFTSDFTHMYYHCNISHISRTRSCFQLILGPYLTAWCVSLQSFGSDNLQHC